MCEHILTKCQCLDTVLLRMGRTELLSEFYEAERYISIEEFLTLLEFLHWPATQCTAIHLSGSERKDSFVREIHLLMTWKTDHLSLLSNDLLISLLFYHRLIDHLSRQKVVWKNASRQTRKNCEGLEEEKMMRSKIFLSWKINNFYYSFFSNLLWEFKPK